MINEVRSWWQQRRVKPEFYDRDQFLLVMDDDSQHLFESDIENVDSIKAYVKIWLSINRYEDRIVSQWKWNREKVNWESFLLVEDCIK